MPRVVLGACVQLLSFVLLSGIAYGEESGRAKLHDRAVPLTAHPEKFDPETSTWMEQVGEHPLAFYFHNFLSDAERQHMLKLAMPQMRRSTVVGQNGDSVVDNIRTSYGMFIMRRQDPVIQRIENRIEMWTQLPFSHQEDIQVLRYTDGQTYGAHYDSSYDKNEKGPHQRLATLLMYLSDVEEGGETAFPHDSVWTDPSLPDKLQGNGWSECAKGHVAAKPKKNDAVLFYSFYRNGTMDPASMHTGCPVLKGIKWAAPVWIHIDEFRPYELIGRPRGATDSPRDPGMCSDYHKECPKWAEAGECKRNPNFMVGSQGGSGNCRKTCGACEDCSPRDIACINRNRKSQGYLEIDLKEMQWLGVDLYDNME